MDKKILNIVVIGSGLSALNFAEEYSLNGKKINIISFQDESLLNENERPKITLLPTQMKGKSINVENFFKANRFQLEKNCKVLGSLDFGGLSNYWGLQIDNYINNDQNINKKNFSSIEKHFLNFLKKYSLIGSYYKNKKVLYKKDYKIPEQLLSLTKEKNKHFNCKQPILGFFNKSNSKVNLDRVNEKNNKLNSKNFFKRIKNNKNLIFHNYYVYKIIKKNNIYEILCKNKTNEKKFYTKKLVLASGTLATTKLVVDYLKIKNEIKIKHHPRLLSVFISKIPIKSSMTFTPSLLQIVKNSNSDCFSGDLRPGNKQITDSIIEAFPYLRPLKIFINLFRFRTLYSNILLDSKDSNIFLKKINDGFKIYSKKTQTKSILKKKNNEIYKFLLKKKIIYPFFYSIFPGVGADYHYFGSIPFNGKGKLSVDNNCQLKNSKNIYIIDGSVFNFKTNKYPLGIVIANARRIGEHLS